ncbi:PREDICTED: uncharacterized protein LOC104770711 isoform X2 [Camelina sativa]|uniref:Uncharacterized protein LOC104770711 isoform X2 n=1 Tax=Camelina sativa TaxID=90675 RepID=A0ABM0Y043_CAMSA|nr:PREDICTED: uncharacterized protein LOC104770711 isoform X2 [Camelina sativa]
MMENGHEERLTEKFSGLGLEDDSSRSLENEFKNDNLFQVIKAVEAAETTIKEQVEENSRLKAELERSALELAKYKSDDSFPQTSNLGDHSNTALVSPLVDQPVDWKQSVIKTSDTDSSGMLVVHPHVNGNGEEANLSNRFEKLSEGNFVNGIVREAINGAGPSQLDSSLSPMRMRLEGEHTVDINSSAHGSVPGDGVNNSGNAWKQDLIHKVQEQEQEISQLSKYLTDCSVKEAQIRNEKYVLEKRIAYMRLAFDQQQQDLVDASSKALSYRQEIIEENIRLTYALQATQQERSAFVSYLLPLLSEYSLQPQVSDAQAIVSNVKVLFKHLQEKLLLTERKLKESEYQLAPWQSDVNYSNNSPLAPLRSAGVALTHSTKDSLYSHDHTAVDWNLERQHQDEPSSSAVRNYHFDESSTFSPLVNSQSAAFEMHVQPGTSMEESPGLKQADEIPPKHVQFREPISKTVVDDAHNSAYVSAFDDPSSSNSPLLSPVLEEPSSSFSEAGDDDPLPAIEDLQISGEPYPGHELQACGYSINGTTSCNFEWVCHLEDGSVNYIDGAKQPNYLVTADDVDLYLAIEVQPLDDRNRKGELVKVFANDNCKITCLPEMQSNIEKTLHTGHASYNVFLATGFLDIREAATLSIKREGYSIKCNNDLIVAEKFSASTAVTIPFGQPAEFVIIGSDGSEYSLRTDNGSTDLIGSRDEIVLTLRLLIKRALLRKKGKKRVFLFNK